MRINARRRLSVAGAFLAAAVAVAGLQRLGIDEPWIIGPAAAAIGHWAAALHYGAILRRLGSSAPTTGGSSTGGS